MKVIVIQQGCLFRVEGKDGEFKNLRPAIGDTISLPKDIAKIEKKSKNVRYLLPEEKENLKRKKKKKKG